jgi:tetratricopeptide (TPR) repeat protein
VQARLQQFARKEGISLTAGVTLEEGIRDAIRLAAADAMVAELVRLVGQNATDLSLLWQACIFPFPVPIEALAFDPACPKAAIDLAPFASVVNRLAATSLLTPLDGNYFYVHRWTAESLQALMPVDTYQACCRRAADYLKFRPALDLRQWVADLVESTRLFLACHAFDEAASSARQVIISLVPRGQTALWTELAREVGNALPAAHDDKSRFVVQEADGMLALGFASEALDCYRVALQLNERKVAQEPGRADYLRDLSVSCNKMGDLQRALGEGEAARQFYEKALELRERLVAQEPGRADYRVDLVKSLARIGGADRLQRALDILLELHRSQRLGKADEQIIVTIEQLLDQAKRASA